MLRRSGWVRYFSQTGPGPGVTKQTRALAFSILLDLGGPVKVNKMNKEQVQTQMEGVRDELNRIDAERAALDTIYRGYESLLKAMSSNGIKKNAQLALGVPGRGGGPKGSISFRNGVIEVIKRAGGESLHVNVIWERMQAMGVKSAAKRPIGFISMIAGKEDAIEKSAASTFRWVGTSS